MSSWHPRFPAFLSWSRPVKRRHSKSCDAHKIEALERRMLLSIATLSNGTGNGSLTLTVDAYGSFGNNSPASGTIYDPFPAGDPARDTVDVSGLYFQPGGNFLSESSVLTNGAPRPSINFDSQDPDSAQSTFS